MDAVAWRKPEESLRDTTKSGWKQLGKKKGGYHENYITSYSPR